jgi:hypothetical protein
VTVGSPNGHSMLCQQSPPPPERPEWRAERRLAAFSFLGPFLVRRPRAPVRAGGHWDTFYRIPGGGGGVNMAGDLCERCQTGGVCVMGEEQWAGAVSVGVGVLCDL